MINTLLLYRFHLLPLLCLSLIACGSGSNSNVSNATPVFTSSNAFSVAENNLIVTQVTATDSDSDVLTYSLSGGSDQAHFLIDNSTGSLSFQTPPDYETRTDSDNNNIYLVEVLVSDGTNTTKQLISITVTNLNEAPFGLSTRPSNSTCAISDPPNTSSNIKLTRVFSNLSFDSPVALRQSPTIADRWYVVEQDGLIKTFLSNDSAATNFLNITSSVLFSPGSGDERGLLGIAFHPNFASNNYVYLYYSTRGGSSSHHSTEQIILRINQPYGNHNGGNILFGPDGYLYIGMGDGGSGGDPENYAQNISSFLGKMLRINVDIPANGNNYSSPADNPYVGVSGLDEIYALGLRNPWRWSFDRSTGDLIAGDVGQSEWEEIDIVTNAGNYGWRCYEGNNAYNTSGCTGSYTAPIHEYSHNDGFSVTGGYVYRGSAIPALTGTYIYSDYGPGPIWGLSDPTGASPVNSSLLLTSIYISSFAEDNNGELYVLSYGDGQIFRIDPDLGSGSGSFPTLLSQTGCIDTNNPLQMASGLIPYDINAPFWSDGIVKDRWMALPDASAITIELDGDWTFPNNSVLVKNFNLNGKRVETRLLVRHADGSWRGYSYEWNNSETDASLLLNGKTTTKEGQKYIYPSTTECMICHTSVTGISLGPQTDQLNRDKTYPSTDLTANQLTTLDNIGLFTSALPDIPANLAKLTEPTDITATTHDRTRAYLYTNCSQCHRQGGPTNVSLDFNIDTADSNMNICNASPTHQIGGATDIMSPGNASNSSLYLRMNCRDGNAGCNNGDQMPPLGSAYVDANGANLIGSWINSLSVCP